MILLTAGETYERMFGIDWQLLADSTLTIIAVFALFAIMSYFLFNPARKMLNDRKEKIREELENAKTSMDTANNLREEYEGKLKVVDKEAEGILSEARSKGLANQAKIIAEAKEEAARILERARVEAQLEKQKMSDDVKKEIISVASAMAGKVVSASINTSVQDQLIDETLKEMGENTWLN
ncbi:MAG: F0F1 ATP synthase subunit B [Lachnospiraceae bacterium]|nr:F0F1 ATP synthase subunit B [Lachnospiraceae bacterium]MBP5222071.1 F0F1 ATP synthase subunit B [Lachnospiraceae bacterium]